MTVEECGQLGEWNQIDPIVKIYMSGFWNDQQLLGFGCALIGVRRLICMDSRGLSPAWAP